MAEVIPVFHDLRFSDVLIFYDVRPLYDQTRGNNGFFFTK